MDRSFYRVRLGRGAKFAEEAASGGFIGVHWGFENDLTGQFDDNWRDFNARLRPQYLARNPESSKIAAGLACGMLWTLGKGMNIGDIVISPDENGSFMIGEVSSDYYFSGGEPIPQRRKVRWFEERVSRDQLSDELKRSTNGPGTIAKIDDHADEILAIIDGDAPPRIVTTDATIEDPSTFALEAHLEEFLVANWAQTELGAEYDIFAEDGEAIGQQYQTDTGPIDILAVSKDRRTILVVELKRGRASDSVVGQIQRYMGYIVAELAEPGQSDKGAIIALEDDLRIRRALSIARDIEFYRYQISFRLLPQEIN